MVHSLGAFVVHLLVVVVLMAAAAAGTVIIVKWGMGEHDAAQGGRAAASANAGARSAEGEAAGRVQTACAKEASSGFRAGLSAARLTAPVAAPASGPRPVIDSDALTGMVQP